jgi:Raf kinase inhibitor-like YbhB/YbcL family protein
MKAFLYLPLSLALMAGLGGCAHRKHPVPEAAMELRIAAFPHQGSIPRAFTADGADLSPALAWTGIPPRTRALALIMDDPDAPVGLWTHWTLYNLPAGQTSLAENRPKVPTLADGSRQGRNTWGRLGYNGPAPPPGKPHRYFFKLYALSEPLALEAGATREQLDKALQGKVVAEAQWMGTYGR